MSLVIIGGGIIGLSIAYYHSLARPDCHIIIIDSESELLKSASGFSGGYIVRDWFSAPVLRLAELSWNLHRQLAEKHGGRQRWGYCESIAYSLVTQVDQAEGSEKKVVRGEDWLLHGTSRAEAAKAYISDAVEATHRSKSSMDCLPRWAKVPAGGKFEKISSPSGCAQVEPRELCEWLIEQCQNRGVEISLNTRPIGLLRDRRGQFSAVQVEIDRKVMLQRHAIPCQDIVISAGCWTPRIFKALLNQQMSPSVKPLPGYSRVVRSSRFSRSILEPARDGHNTQIAHATFYPPTSKWPYSPECMARYTRSGKPEIYVAGLNDESIRLPERAGDVKHVMDRSKLDDLKTTARDLVGVDDDTELELVRESLCCRPVSDSGLPIISQVGGIKTSKGGRMYVASGHGPWGISLSLGTGFVISELLQNKKHEALTKEMELNKQLEMLRARL